MFKWIVLIAIIILGWLIGWANNQSIALSLLVYKTPSLPVFVWLFLAVLLGFVLGLLSSLLVKRPKGQKDGHS